MSSIDPNQQLLRLHDELKKYGPPKPLEPLASIVPPGKCRCACGAKCMPLEEVKYKRAGALFFNSRLVPPFWASDAMCDECDKQVKNFAIMVCLNCKSVAAKMPPERLGGFKFEANKAYHLDGCPICCPGVEKTTCIEKSQYDLERKNK